MMEEPTVTALEAGGGVVAIVDRGAGISFLQPVFVSSGDTTRLVRAIEAPFVVRSSRLQGHIGARLTLFDSLLAADSTARLEVTLTGDETARAEFAAITARKDGDSARATPTRFSVASSGLACVSPRDSAALAARTATLTFTVRRPAGPVVAADSVPVLVLEPTRMRLTVGDTARIVSRILDTAAARRREPMAWGVSDSTVASVRARPRGANIVALAPGQALVGARLGSAEVTMPVTVVALGSVVVPRLEGMTLGDARQALAKIGLVGLGGGACLAAPVLSHQPAAGQRVRVRSSVALMTEDARLQAAPSGPAGQLRVPDVRNLDPTRAAAALGPCFSYRWISSGRESATEPGPSRIVDQDPAPGTTAPIGTEVSLGLGGENARLALQVLEAMKPGFSPQDVSQAIDELAKLPPAEFVRSIAGRSKLEPAAFRVAAVRVVLCREATASDPPMTGDPSKYVDALLVLPEARERFPACLLRRPAAAR